MKVCAGIVLYNPDISRLKENVDAILPQVDKVLLVNNGSNNIEEIIAFKSNYGNKIAFINSDKNNGIAWALNRILEFSKDNEFQWYITLDQDSICESNLITNYLKFTSDEVGQLSCIIDDRNLGTIDAVDFENKDFVEIEHCITSGCLNNNEAAINCGGYDESLFIDGVDLDFSCNLRTHGYKILCCNFHGLIHELGDGFVKNLAGRKVELANHVPWRNYYARRNLIYVARKYYKGKEYFFRIFKQIAYGIGATLLEDKKCERFKYNFKGIIDGFNREI